MARHIMVRLKDGRAWAVRTALTNAGEDPLRFWEEVITEQYDRIQELESRSSRLALYGRLIDRKFGEYQVALVQGNRELGLSIQNELYDILTRMQREENNQ